MTDRTILHCDMNSFYASVELLDYPELLGEPVTVCGNPENRHGIILAKNEIAKSFGVVTAETIYSARKKCPHLKAIPLHREKYTHYSKILNEIYGRHTDLVEPFSIDESWLDVTASRNLFGSGKKIADEIRNTVKKELGLTLSAGVSFNKVMAKMGSEYKKPDATTLITEENFRSLLWPLPVRNLFFVGGSTAKKLRDLGIFTIGDLAKSDKIFIAGILGKHGEMIHNYANAIDDSPVLPSYERSKIHSIGHGITFKRNLVTSEDIATAIISLSDKVCSRMRHKQMKAKGIKVDITDSEFRTISRQMQLEKPSNSSFVICKAAEKIIQSNWKNGVPIRLLSITGINLSDETEPIQLSLFDEGEASDYENPPLDSTIDMIRKKYGKTSITYGRILNNDIGIDIIEEEKNNL